jgi:DNA processing protein
MLMGVLAPRIASLPRGDATRIRLLLALPDRELVEAVAPRSVDSVLAEFRLFRADACRERVAAARLESVCRHDAAYPPALLQLPDAPCALFIRGDLASLAELVATPAVAIVGTRRASTYALEVAQELGRSLTVAGVPVVSGLALGVDAAAHRGVVSAGGRAVAVLASGADVPYPRTNRQLYASIVASGGAIVSEMPPGTTAWRWAFPARNRIMAAHARMVVVAEAAEQSGSLITADIAESLGRDVGAVPGRVNAKQAAGSNKLLASGAAVVLGVEDILDSIFYAGARPVPPRVELDQAAEAVLDRVEAGDSPLGAGGLDAKEVRATLGRLESLRLIRRDGLGGYERTGVRCARA